MFDVNSLQNSPRHESFYIKILWLGGCGTLVTRGKGSRKIRRGHQKIRTEYFQDLHLPLDQSLADSPSHREGKTWSGIKLLYSNSFSPAGDRAGAGPSGEGLEAQRATLRSSDRSEQGRVCGAVRPGAGQHLEEVLLCAPPPWTSLTLTTRPSSTSPL